MNEENEWLPVLKVLIKAAYVVTEGFLILLLTIFGFVGILLNFSESPKITFEDIIVAIGISLILHAIPVVTIAITFLFDKKWFKAMCIVTGITIIYMSLIFV